MSAIDVRVECELSQTIRSRQVRSMFDVPRQERAVIEWKGELPIEDRPWSIGLIVGPSGTGKSTIARETFGFPAPFDWKGKAVVDDFPKSMSIEDITTSLSAVGFSTIPAWLRPFEVLSTGEKFRVDVARRMAEHGDNQTPIVIDEFTSTVDRQVAKIASHSVQKSIRKAGKRLVAVTCHYDVIDWLQPDWVLDPSTMTFAWRELQRRPTISGHLQRIGHDEWKRFAPFHYLTTELSASARCFGLFVDGIPYPIAFTGCLYRPHPQNVNVIGNSRTVTLPDWQGLGFGFVLMESLGAAFRGIGFRFRSYPAHPSFVRSFDRSKAWTMLVQPGTIRGCQPTNLRADGRHVQRPCAVFEYAGPTIERSAAADLLRWPTMERKGWSSW